MTQARLVAGDKTFIFPLAPETINQAFTGDYAANAVLDLTNPRVRRKSSNTVTRLERCLFISQGLVIDQYPYLNTLQYWAREQTNLKFYYNKIYLPSCYIKSLNVTIKQYRNGKPVHAEVDIDLLESSVVVKTTKALPAKKITPREKANAVKTIKGKLVTPTKRASLGILGSYDVSISELSEVTIVADGNTTNYDYDSLLKLLA